MKDLSSDNFSDIQPSDFVEFPLPTNPMSATFLLMIAKTVCRFLNKKTGFKFVRTSGVSKWAGSLDDKTCDARNGWLVHCLARHFAGDDGDLCAEDKEANRQAVKHGGRILSVYAAPDPQDERRLYIITEADRSLTTLLWADEY